MPKTNGIPKPILPPKKGAVITLTPEQVEKLVAAGFNRTISFVVGSPIRANTKEHPRQETPYILAKRAGRVGQAGQAGRKTTLKPKRLFQD